MTASDPDLDSLLDNVPWVRKLALQLCSDAHRAEDAAQEACLLAAQRPPRDRGLIRAYLARILRNVLHRDGRSERRRDRREHAFAALRQVEVDDPGELVARAELHAALVAAVLELPDAQRQVVLLHHFEGLEVADVARRVGRSADAVRALLRRARDELRVGLERRGRNFAAVLWSLGGAGAPVVPVVVTLGAFVMKTKILAAAAVVLLACLSIPFLSQRPSPGANDGPTGHSAAVTSATGGERPVPVEDSTPASVQRVAAPVVGRVIEGHLLGLDARLPWSTSLSCTAEWRRDGETVRHEVSVAVGPSGSFRCAMAQWDAASTALRTRWQASDPGYEPLDATFDLADGAAAPLELPVVAAPTLIGRVVAPDGAGIAGVQVVGFAASDGVPRASRLAADTSAADGGWRVRLPAAGQVFVVAVPPSERTDIVVTGVAVEVRGLTDLGEVRMTGSSPVTGTVRWNSGAPVDGAEVDWRVRAEVTLDKGLGLGWAAGHVMQRRVAVSGGDGRFVLPAAAGEVGSVMVQRVAGCLPATFTVVKATAPQDVDVLVDGRPLTIRVLRDGEPAGLSGVQWRRDRFAGNYGTDKDGVLRQLVLDEPLRLRAVSMDQQLASEWVEFEKGAIPDELVLQLLPLDGERVVVRLDGAVLDHVGFVWTSSAVPATHRSMSLRVADGAFVMRAPAGAQRLRLTGVFGQLSEYLLPTEIEVSVPPPGDVVVPVRLGGRLRLVVTDAQGTFVAGRYQLLRDGVATAAARATRPGLTPPTTMTLPAGGEHFSAVYEPGTYELVLDLGAAGETRRAVELVAGRTSDVRVTLP